jgi:serine/threonine protein kinase
MESTADVVTGSSAVAIDRGISIDDGGYKIKKKVHVANVADAVPAPTKAPELLPETSRFSKTEVKPEIIVPENSDNANHEQREDSNMLGKRQPRTESPKKSAISGTLADFLDPNTKIDVEGVDLVSSKQIDDGVQHYEFSKLLGSGTFGVVSKYRDMRTKRYVAIKKVICENSQSWQNRELSMLEKLIHPNIVGVKSSFKTEESPDKSSSQPKRFLNIVMDYIPDNLHKIIQHFVKQKATCPDTLVMIYSYQLFRCLHFLRVHSVAHRDIKPQNILVDTSSHQLFFCDFGSAKVLKSEEPSEDYICSRFYRAPELLYGNKNYTCSVDTWSVGCVMAEMVLGMPIFIGENTQDQIAKIIEHIGQPDDAEMKAMGSKVPAAPRKNQPLLLKQRLQTKINKDGLDLMTRVFAYDPEKRIKPLDALQHPYFDPVRVQRMSINKTPITDLFNFNQEETRGYERYIRKLTPDWYQK